MAKLSSDVYKAFRKWAWSYYAGLGYPLPENTADIQSDDAYKMWVRMGSPGYQEVTAQPSGQPPSWVGGGTTPQQWQTGGVPLTGTAALTALSGVKPGAPPTTTPTEEKKIGGYTAEEWEYGVPQWMAQQAQAMRQENLRASEVYGQMWQQSQDIQSRQIQAALAGFQGGQGQQQLAGEFERARQSILATAIDPSDWITRWAAENAINPYTPNQCLKQKKYRTQ